MMLKNIEVPSLLPWPIQTFHIACKFYFQWATPPSHHTLWTLWRSLSVHSVSALRTCPLSVSNSRRLLASHWLDGLRWPLRTRSSRKWSNSSLKTLISKFLVPQNCTTWLCCSRNGSSFWKRKQSCCQSKATIIRSLKISMLVVS